MAQLIFKVLQWQFIFLKYVWQYMLKNEISIHKFCPQSVSKHSVVHFQGVAMIFSKIWMRFKGHRWLNSFLNRSKNISGVWMGFKGHRWRNSFSRYCNDIAQVFHFFGQNMLKNEICIHKFCPQSVLKPSVVHFQGVAVFDDLNAI